MPLRSPQGQPGVGEGVGALPGLSRAEPWSPVLPGSLWQGLRAGGVVSRDPAILRSSQHSKEHPWGAFCV